MQLLQWNSKPTTFVALSSAHRTIHLRHGGWGTSQKLAGLDCYVIELLALSYCFGWSTHQPNTCSFPKRL